MAGAEAVGLSASEWYALSQIALEGTLTSGELAARTGLTTGATTRLIDCLERAGFVRRAADPDDRRKVIVEPVADSLDRVEKVVGPARRSGTQQHTDLSARGVRRPAEPEPVGVGRSPQLPPQHVPLVQSVQR